jgi:hypothetical protein
VEPDPSFVGHQPSSPGITVTVAAAVFVLSACDVAVIVSMTVLDTVLDGAVYTPEELMTPYTADQVTAVVDAFKTDAEKLVVASAKSEVDVGETEMVIGSGETITVAVELTVAMLAA